MFTLNKNSTNCTMNKKPTLEQFREYAYNWIARHGDDPKRYSEYIDLKYESWSLANWHKEKGGKLVPIHIWQTTLLQALPYRQPNKGEGKKTPVKRKTDNFTDDILKAYRVFKDKGSLPSAFSDVFKPLFRMGVLPPKSEVKYYKDKKMIAGAYLIAGHLDEKKTATHKEAKIIDNRIQAIKEYRDPRITPKAMALAVEDFFKGITESELHRVCNK